MPNRRCRSVPEWCFANRRRAVCRTCRPLEKSARARNSVRCRDRQRLADARCQPSKGGQGGAPDSRASSFRADREDFQGDHGLIVVRIFASGKFGDRVEKRGDEVVGGLVATGGYDLLYAAAAEHASAAIGRVNDAVAEEY